MRSHAVGMLGGRGGIVGVTAPFFTAIIRASCQGEGPEDGGRRRVEEGREGVGELRLLDEVGR